MLDHKLLPPGTRVRVRSASHLVDLRSSTGVVVRPDEWDGHYVIRLDEPALYHDPDGTERDLWEISEAADNMEAAPLDRSRA